MIGWKEEYSVGNEGMDSIHRQFVQLLDKTAHADNSVFEEAFGKLLEHTREHFDYEEVLMKRHRSASAREHQDEHLHVIAEMEYFLNKVRQGRVMFARAYITQKLPDWLRQHTATMDADLAASIRM